MEKEVKVRFLNKETNYSKYLEEALSFDTNDSWLFDDEIDNDVIWSLEDKRFSSFTYGLFLEEELIGLMMIDFTENEEQNLVFETSIIIHPEYRKCGMGNFLLQSVMQELQAKSKLISSLHATIYADNIPSQQLVLKNGFVFQKEGTMNNKLIYMYQCNLKEINKEKKMS